MLWSSFLKFVRVIYCIRSKFGFGFKGRKKELLRISGIKVSGFRTIAHVETDPKPPDIPFEATVECDSHADTCVLGRNFVVLERTSRVCDVLPFSDSLEGVQAVPIVSGGTVWTCPVTHESFLLIIHEALWMPEQMQHTLINPNQLRSYGVSCLDNAFIAKLSIEAPADDGEMVEIPMDFEGGIVLFRSRTPEAHELRDLRRIELTSRQPWNPKDLRAPKLVTNVSSMERVNARLALPENEEDFVRDFNSRLISSCRVLDIPTRRINAVEIPDYQDDQVLEERPWPNVHVSEKRRSQITPDVLADRWLIGRNQAKKTLETTTQLYTRNADDTRRFRPAHMLKYRRLRGEWATDTIKMPRESTNGFTCMQIFTNDSYFAQVYPMHREGQSGEALEKFCKEVGVPEFLRADGGSTMVGRHKPFQQTVRKHRIRFHPAEAGMKNQNPAEGVIREVKRKWFKAMMRKGVPQAFWDFGLTWCADIMSRTFSRSHAIDGMVPLQGVEGSSVDISDFLDFSLWDHVWYLDATKTGTKKPGRWLGVAHTRGDIFAYSVLTESGKVLVRSSVWRPTVLELQTAAAKDIFDKFNSEIERRFPSVGYPTDGDRGHMSQWGLLNKDPEFQEVVAQQEGDVDVKEAFDDRSDLEGRDLNEFTPEVSDESYLNAELCLPRGNEIPLMARVKRRKLDKDGLPLGVAHNNPHLDTRSFEVEYEDGTVEALSANVIAEHMFAQVDHNGHRFLLMDEIIDVRKTSKAVPKEEGFVTTQSGKRRRITTRGWEFLIRWKDGTETWSPLKDMKEAYPVQVAEFVVQSQLNDEPAFAWWVPHVINKRKSILAKVKSKYWQQTHKYGIELPKSVEHARKIDQKNGNDLWMKAIEDEMRTITEANAVEVIEDNVIPVGYEKIKCHFIFDIKLGENFRRKARYVAGGHMTEVSPDLTYSSVVSRDSVRICLMLATLNGLDVQACDIKGAYLTAPAREKLVTIAGDEFGPALKGKLLKITKALYGQKSAGAAFRSYLADHLWKMDFRRSEADPDVWMRPAKHPNGKPYYEYVLCYVDDLLAISLNAKEVLLSVAEKFKLKNDKISPPEDYLGAVLRRMNVLTCPGGCWSQSSMKYVQAALENVERSIQPKGELQQGKGGKFRGSKYYTTPLRKGYKPELDTTPELKGDDHRFYQELIGVLRWSTELGRIDILHHVGLMSQYLANPRKGHLDAVLHIFGYLKHHLKYQIAFDPSHPNFRVKFKKCDWTDHYPGAEEAISPNAPKPRGKSVSTHCFVDASFANNVMNRRSWMGVLIFVNRAPVMWMSKRTNTVEASTFGAEIIAMRHSVDMIVGLRYKLRMFGVPLEGSTNVFCDNEAVTKNVTEPSSTLSKKHHSINYHRCREATAARIIQVAHEPSLTNLADPLTKILGPNEFHEKIQNYMY